MATAPDSRLPARERKRYVLDGEKVIFAVNQHWLVILEPVATVLAVLVLAIYLDATLPGNARTVANVGWWVWFATILRAGWRVHEWRHEWFIATNKRMLRVYGTFDRQVAMMPLGKVTDMRYERSIPGRLFGYGTYIMESAGQVQALQEVDLVPNPDKNYRAIVAEMFGVDDDGEVDEDLLDEPDDGDVEYVYDGVEHGPRDDRRGEDRWARYGRRHQDDGRGPDTLDDLPAVQVEDRYGDLRSWHEHFGEPRTTRRRGDDTYDGWDADDTGPIHLHR